MVEKVRYLPRDVITTVVQDPEAFRDTVETRLESLGNMYRQLNIPESEIPRLQENHRRNIYNSRTRFLNPNSPEVRQASNVEETGEIRRRAEMAISHFFDVTNNIAPQYTVDVQRESSGNTNLNSDLLQTNDARGSYHSSGMYDNPIINSD